jgi:hypothetical protein
VKRTREGKSQARDGEDRMGSKEGGMRLRKGLY